MSEKNIFIPRIAGEVRPGMFLPRLRRIPLLARIGYSFVPPFTPDQTGVSNFLDNPKHIIGLGVRYVMRPMAIIRRPTIIDFSFQWQIWTERETIKEDKSNPLNPDYTYGGNVFVFSLSSTWYF